MITREKRNDGVQHSHTLSTKGESMKTTADEIRETIIELCQALREPPKLPPRECGDVADAINTLSAALINAVNAEKAHSEVGVAADIDEGALVKGEGTENGQRPVDGYLVQWSRDGGNRGIQFRETMKGARALADALEGFSYRSLTISEVHIGETVWMDNGETAAANKDATEGNRSVIPSCRWDGKAWVWS